MRRAIEALNKKRRELLNELTNMDIYERVYNLKMDKLNNHKEEIIECLKELGFKNVSWDEEIEYNHYSKDRDYSEMKDQIMSYIFKVTYKTYKDYNKAQKRLDILKKRFDERFNCSIRMSFNPFIFQRENDQYVKIYL